MDLILKKSGGQNIVLRPQAQPRWRPAATTHPATVEVWWRRESEPLSARRLAGVFRPGEEVSIPYDPDVDENVVVTARSISASGTPNVVDLSDGVSATLIHQRETEAPIIGQIGEATADRVSIGITEFSRHARKRRIRISASSDMTDPIEILLDSADYASKELPRFFDIDRGVFTPAYTLDPDADPAANGWTKTGSGTTSASGGGWLIDTATTNAQAFYTKNSFEASPFADGFTLELPVPDVTAFESPADEAQAVAVRVRSSNRQYTLSFDDLKFCLNDSVLQPHGGAGSLIRLVIASTDLADVYVDDVLVISDVAAEVVGSGSSSLEFGDLVTSDDGTAIWRGLKYAFAASVPALPQTIYVTCAHSGGTLWGTESDVLELSFADDHGSGGSAGDFNPVPRDKYILDLE